jgi:hypothetical protein
MKFNIKKTSTLKRRGLATNFFHTCPQWWIDQRENLNIIIKNMVFFFVIKVKLLFYYFNL